MVLKVSNSGPVHAGRRDTPHLHEIHPGRRSENAHEVRRENLRHPVGHQYQGAQRRAPANVQGEH